MMRIRYQRLLLSIFILSFSAFDEYAQSPAYAKFDSKSSTIGLYNLLPDTTACEASRVFSGTIKILRREPGTSAHRYSFTLSTTPRLAINVIIQADEILQADADDLIANSRRVRVRARPCGSGGIWTAEEIKRL
jgi:hypothetical protein